MISGRAISSFYAAAALLAMSPDNALAQQCDTSILALASGTAPYGPRAGGRYCEGSFARPVSATFEVLAVTSGSISFSSNDANIFIAAPLSPIGSSLDVRARGRASNFGYQMDTKLNPPTAFTWPRSTAIIPLGLDRNALGVFGYRRVGSSFVYVPVSVGRNAGSPNTGPILVQLIAPEHLDGPIQFLVSPNGQTGPLVWQTLRESGANKGEVLALRVAEDGQNLPLNLRVKAPVRRNEKGKNGQARMVQIDMELSR